MKALLDFILSFFRRAPAAPDVGPATVSVTPAGQGYPITGDHLRAMFPHLGVKADEWAAALRAAFAIGGITTRRRAARFLAIVSQETGGFRVQEENLNYGVDRLRAVFGPHRITDEEIARYGRTATRPADQEALANILYGRGEAARQLGNTQPGDGWKFRGRGLLQSTGRAHHQRIADRMGMSIDAVIPWLLTVGGSAIGSAIIWQALGGNQLADGDDFAALVKRMNGAHLGLAERTAYLAKWERIL